MSHYCIRLPSLRSASFSSKAGGSNLFFQKHGGKLEELTVSVPQLDSNLNIFGNCPSIKVLGISCDVIENVRPIVPWQNVVDDISHIPQSVPRLESFKPPGRHMLLERIIFKPPLYLGCGAKQHPKL